MPCVAVSQVGDGRTRTAGCSDTYDEVHAIAVDGCVKPALAQLLDTKAAFPSLHHVFLLLGPILVVRHHTLPPSLCVKEDKALTHTHSITLTRTGGPS